MLEHYLFHTRTGDMLLALGLGSMFNHSRTPNLDYRVDSAQQVGHVVALPDSEPWIRRLKARQSLTEFLAIAGHQVLCISQH